MNNSVLQDINVLSLGQNSVGMPGENEAKASYLIHCRPSDLHQAQIAARSRFRLDKIVNQIAKIYLGISLFNYFCRPYCSPICTPLEWLNAPGACGSDFAHTAFSIALVGTITITCGVTGAYVLNSLTNPITRRIFGEDNLFGTPRELKEIATAVFNDSLMREVIGSSSPVETALNDAILSASGVRGGDK